MGLHDYSNNTQNPPSGNNNNGNNGGIGGGMGMGIPINLNIPQSPPQNDIDALEYVINYNDKFKTAGTTLFRDELIQQTLAVLIGKNKPNALLIGPAGVGKTKIVEDIAFRLANDSPLIPDKLKGHTIYALPLANIVAGSSYVGQVEEKIKAVIDFMSDKNNKAILFIDEIHMLVGDAQTYEKIAQILKPALSRGEMKIIGATTSQESRKLATDPAFNRRFSKLIVDELSREQTIEILSNAKAGFFQHHSNKISISDDILETVAILADQYKTAGSHRPDNALTLLDRAIGEAIVNRKVQEQKAQNDPVLLQAIQSVPIIPITEKQIKSTAIKLMTGNSKKDDLNIEKLKERLADIKGQDEIIETILDILRRNDLNLFKKDKPLTLLFAGTSGVGKTEITKIIADELTGVKPITLNMTEYHSSASINRIIGAPPGYAGCDSNAELPFDCLESNPYQIILLDEFEKCDKAVQRLFMSAFEEGYIKDNQGKIVDFSKSIIIATTNAAHKDLKKSLGFNSNLNSVQKPSNEETIKELSKWFDTELINRFQTILTFNTLSEDLYRDIIIHKYHTEVARIRADKHRVSLLDDIPQDDLERIIKETYVPEFGARPASKAVKEYIENQVM